MKTCSIYDVIFFVFLCVFCWINSVSPDPWVTISWASYKIDKIVGCACAGNAGNVFPPPRVGDPSMHHGTYVKHAPWCMPGRLTSGLFCSRWRGKRSRHSRRMRNPQFYVPGKRPIITPLEYRTNFDRVILNNLQSEKPYQNCLKLF